MSHHLRSWFLLGLVSAVSLVAGYALPHPAKKGGDMLEAVAVVQRRIPLHLVSERGCPPSWVTEGGIYLSRTNKSTDDVENLIKEPVRYDRRWQGVVYFKNCGNRDRVAFPILTSPRERILDYGDFAVYGDPELLQEVRPLLEGAGFQAAG
jgi:hypothetical protein